MSKYKRRIKLIKPRLQIQLTLVFLGLSVLGLLMQFLLFQAATTRIASVLPSDGNLVMSEINGTLLSLLGITLLAIMPVTYLIGVLTTFRIAGPAYRMEQYFKDLQQNGYTGPCRIRKGDQLQELVAAMNKAVETLAHSEPVRVDESESPPTERRAA